ncbi:hypothetical protein HHK36_017422 [Tetracentron sinense]|uniref:ENT domain-containing protein n=1 Tax=Tetracentron sinense TaxID=13715 RepID=A0A835DBW8_TETSI|nr:hypothetical protein HHK36_017422 [Tetracentron sinense]
MGIFRRNTAGKRVGGSCGIEGREEKRGRKAVQEKRVGEGRGLSLFKRRFGLKKLAMEYELSDSSGTDDDLPPSHQNRVSRGVRVAGNGRSSLVGSVPYPRMYGDMETHIHHIEQEAYSSVLRAFKAQSDAITWEKEGLITELRKELRVSDEEHRELLGRVNADDIIRRIREWRQAGGLQPGMLSTAQPVHDPIPSPSVSASRKKQKTLQSVPSLSLGMPSPALHPQTVAASMQPSLSAAKRGAAVGAKGKKPKPGQTLPGVSSIKSMQYPSTGPTGRGQVANRGSSGALVANEPAEAATFDPLIGRKVMTRWPEDNNFYEAVITDYNPVEGRHALVYDINTKNETWEWVNLKEVNLMLCLHGKNILLSIFSIVKSIPPKVSVRAQTNLCKQKVPVENVCGVCGEEGETILHALKQCHYARQVWLLSQFGLRSDATNADSLSSWAEEIMKPHGEEGLSAFFMIAWSIWKHKNECIFTGAKMTAFNYVQRANKLIADFHNANDRVVPESVSEARSW